MVKSNIQGRINDNREWLLLLILAVAIRVLFILNSGLSNDELSALYRTGFQSWSDFWFYGVREGDMHPVFFQAVLWLWTRLFGTADWVFRMVALLFFVINFTLLYRIAKDYFSKYSGLLLCALYTGSSFFIIHTSTSRPYSSGLFFLLLLVYILLGYFTQRNKPSYSNISLLVLATLGAMLSHYFAFLCAGVFLGISFLFLPKRMFSTILLAGGIACVLFLPHLSVTWYQVQKGGVRWLSSPSFFWWIEFTRQIVQDSWWLLIGLILFFATLRFRFGTADAKSRFLLYSSVAIGLIAYFISLKTPILRELVFQFIFPFLFLGLMGTLKPNKPWLKAQLPLLFGLGLIIHSLIIQQLLVPRHYGVFKELADNQIAYRSKYSPDSISVAHNFNQIGYLNYYSGIKEKESIQNWADSDALYELNERVETSKTPYFLYNWSNNYHIPMYLEVIRRKFTVVEEATFYFNSGDVLFSKKKTNNKYYIDTIVGRMDDQVDSTEFFATGEMSISAIRDSLGVNGYLILEMQLDNPHLEEFFIVATIERNGQMLLNGKEPFRYWAYEQSRLMKADGKIYVAIDIPEESRNTDVLKWYAWNPKGQEICHSGIQLYLLNWDETTKGF